MYDQSVLMEDPFYNFEEMSDNNPNISIQSVLDPSNPNSIPFFDECFSVTPPPSFSQLEEETEEGGAGFGVGGGVSEFDPELFNSILTTGDDILARLESTSSASGSVGSFEAGVGGNFEGGGDPAPVGVARGVVSGGVGVTVVVDEEEYDDRNINRPGQLSKNVIFVVWVAKFLLTSSLMMEWL